MRGVAALIVVLAVAITALAWLTVGQAADAAAPFDGHRTAPDDPSEMAGTGYLLTDPSQPGKKTEWAGAYNTLAGLKAYCIDHSYNYPRRQFGYAVSEVAQWSPRAGATPGAAGHTAQRISWIVNSYGQSAARSTTAAVSLAINLVADPVGFGRLYRAYFRPQLVGLDPGVVTGIERMLADSDRYAGPYSTRVIFGPAPPVGGVGTFSVSVRSAQGVALRNAGFRVTTTSGMTLTGPSQGSTGPTGVARVAYRADRSGPVRASAYGIAPGTTIRLAHSPGHDGPSFTTGSQRVVAVSALAARSTPGGSGTVTVQPPVLDTAVVGGPVGRPVGAQVRDRVDGSGLVPRQQYSLIATLLDSRGTVCATRTSTVLADPLGSFSLVTGDFPACGTGVDTFVERLLTPSGQVAVQTPAGQPAESFAVTPGVSTTVEGGSVTRPLGAPVRDRITGLGFAGSAAYSVRVELLDHRRVSCGVNRVPVTSDVNGLIQIVSAPLPACGVGPDTFVETISDRLGRVVARTASGEPSESFEVLPPPAPLRPPARSGSPAVPSTSRVPPRSTTPPPALSPHPPTSVAQPPVRPTPTLLLASTGAAGRTAGSIGLIMVGCGLAMTAIAKRRSRVRPADRPRHRCPVSAKRYLPRRDSLITYQ